MEPRDKNEYDDVTYCFTNPTADLPKIELGCCEKLKITPDIPYKFTDIEQLIRASIPEMLKKWALEDEEIYHIPAYFSLDSYPKSQGTGVTYRLMLHYKIDGYCEDCDTIDCSCDGRLPPEFRSEKYTDRYRSRMHNPDLFFVRVINPAPKIDPDFANIRETIVNSPYSEASDMRGRILPKIQKDHPRYAYFVNSVFFQFPVFNAETKGLTKEFKRALDIMFAIANSVPNPA